MKGKFVHDNVLARKFNNIMKDQKKRNQQYSQKDTESNLRLYPQYASHSLPHPIDNTTHKNAVLLASLAENHKPMQKKETKSVHTIQIIQRHNASIGN